MATSASLQAEVEELQRCCPRLCPTVVPAGYDVLTPAHMAQIHGLEPSLSFAATLDDASQPTHECCICGTAGRPVGDGGDDSDDDEPSTASADLDWMVMQGISFADKTVTLKAAGKACGLCRALLDTKRMVRFAALRSSDDQQERQLLLELCSHLASVNRADEDLQADPDLLMAWFQELYSRAYALQVVASNLRGWRMLDSSGRAPDLHSAKGAAALAKALLEQQQQQQQQKPKAPKLSAAKLAGPAPTAPPTKAKKAKGKQAGQDAEQAAAKAVTAGSKGPKQPAGDKEVRGKAGSQVPGSAQRAAKKARR